jgi:tetratricopeptide (TPR) repeat protein
VIGSAVGPYQVLEELGTGGTGDVFLGYDTRLQRRVALKCLTIAPGDQEALIFREARAAARLNHPNIAAVYDVVEHGHRAFIVMEYVDGENLAERMMRGRLPIDRVRQVGRQIALALIAAHEQGVVHRDLRPANIHLTRDGSIKVLGFGIAKLLPESALASDGETTQTGFDPAPGASAGSPVYMSPEQLFGHPVDSRTDTYSAGVLLFELATGRRPYQETGATALALAITAAPPPAARSVDAGVPQDLSEAIARALEREPARRFDSARDLERALDVTPASPTAAWSSATTQATAAAPASHRWMRWWKPALAAALLLAVAAAARDPGATRRGLARVGLVRPVRAPMRLVIAILPVANPTHDPQGEYLGAGIRSALSGNFGSIRGITVRPLTETAPYRKESVDVTGLQRDLGATHVIDLSLAAVKPSPRLVARLYRAGNTTPEWEEAIEGDPLSIQRTVLARLATALESSAPPRVFTVDEWRRIQRLPTTSGAAFAAYSEAIALADRDPVENAGRAIALLQVATEIDPRFAIAWATLGNAWWDRYQRENDQALAANAVAAVDRAIAIDADRAEVHYALGVFQSRTGRVSEAVDSFRRVLALRPEDDDAHRLLGETLGRVGRVDEAESELRLAVHNRESWNNYFSLGTVQYRTGRYPDAAAAFRRTTELAPQNAAAFRMLGTTYYESGKFDDAMRSYDEAVKLEPTSALNHRNLGDAYRRLGRGPDARAQYDEAVTRGSALLAVKPHDVGVLSLIAICEAKLGNSGAAIRHAAAAVALEPDNRDVLQRSAEVHALLNQPDAALRDLESAIARGFEPRIARNDDDLASLRRLPRFEQILNAAPGDPVSTPGVRE